VAEMESRSRPRVVAEVYGFDSPSLMGYLSALTERVQIGSGIMNIYSRTPSLIAMTPRASTRSPTGVSTWASRLGPPGHRGFLRRAVRESTRANSRDRGYLPQNLEARAPLVHEGKNFTLSVPSDQGTVSARPSRF